MEKPQFSSTPMQVYKDFVAHRKGPLEKWEESILETAISTLKKSVHFELPERDIENSKELLARCPPDFTLKLPYSVVSIFRKSSKGYKYISCYWEGVEEGWDVIYFWAGTDLKDTDDAHMWYPGRSVFSVSQRDLKNKETDPMELIKIKAGLKGWVGGKPMYQMALHAFVDVYDLCAILDKGAPTIETVNTASSLRMKTGQAAKGLSREFYKLHRVVINNTPKVIEISEHKGGTHASPRWHKRRGYWRTMRKSGTRVWVRECEVGDKSNGMIYKDYEVKGDNSVQ